MVDADFGYYLDLSVADYYPADDKMTVIDYTYPRAVYLPFPTDYVVEKILDGFQVEFDVNPSVMGETKPVAMILDNIKIYAAGPYSTPKIKAKIVLVEGLPAEPSEQESDVFDNLLEMGFDIVNIRSVSMSGN